MRLRKVKNAYERLTACTEYFIDAPEQYKGGWRTVFSNTQPLHIEIGCGKGQFILTLAKRNPQINYIAIEKYDSVLLRTMEKLKQETLPNIRLVLLDASRIGEYFAEGEVDRIYLNFSDPWPKTAHAKRRLTSGDFLRQYRYILSDTGEIHQKTDNRNLFEFSLQSFSENNWRLQHISLDLHRDTEKYPDNIPTEFEDKWSEFGPIYRLEALKK